MEVKFEYRRGTFSGSSLHAKWVSGYPPAILCHKGVREHLDLPHTNKIKCLWAVFTKKNTSNSFRLVKHTGGIQGRCVVLEGIFLLHDARKICERMYRKGYRYVHIEYEEKE